MHNNLPANANMMLQQMWNRICCLQKSVDLIVTPSGIAWNIVGNTGLQEENFLGTTDAVDFILKTDSEERLRVTAAGLIGIGTNSPTAALDVNGQIRLRGGSPGVGKILQSDANGVGSWVDPSGITVSANNGLIVSSGIAQLGSPTVGGANLLHNSYVNNNGFEFAMYDGPTNLTFRINPVNGYYQLGANIVNGAYASFDATANQFTLQAANANYINLDGINSIFKVVMRSGFNFLELDASAQTYKIGDISPLGDGNNNYIEVDDNNQIVTFFNSKLKASGYGTGAFTGTPTYGLYVDASGNIIEGSIAGGGTVTSVALSMPSAFSVGGSPITGSGTLAVTATGTTSQYIRGNGTLATLPVTTAFKGTSLSGTQVQLGQDYNAAGDPALISDIRQIPISVGSGSIILTAPTQALFSQTFTANSHSVQGSNAASPSINMLVADLGKSLSITWNPTAARYSITASDALLINSPVAINSVNVIPTASLQLPAGTAVAGTAPLKLTVGGTLLTIPENGAVEITNTHLYVTLGGTRYQLDQQYSFSNGLTNTSGAVTFGGTIVTPTTLTMATGGDRVTFTGTSNSTAFGILQAIDNGVGHAILALQSTASGKGITSQHTAGGVAINALSSGGTAVSAQDNGAGVGLSAYSETGIPITVISNTNNNNATSTGLRLTRNNGTIATGGGVGMGIDILVQLEDSSGSGAVTNASKISTYWTDATAGSENSSMDFWTINNGVFDSKLSIKDTGKIQLTKYGINTFAGTAAYMLGVDASGNVVETTGGGGSQDLQSVTTVGNTTTNDIIIGARTNSVGRFSVEKTFTALNVHAFDDYSTLNPSSGGFGFGVFDASTSMIGSQTNDHFIGFQSRLTVGSGSTTNINGDYGLTGLLVFNHHAGSGTVTNAHGILIKSINGGGPITNAYGIRIEPVNYGTTNWGIVVGGGKSSFVDPVMIGLQTTPIAALDVRSGTQDQTMYCDNTKAGGYAAIFNSTNNAGGSVALDITASGTGGGGKGLNFGASAMTSSDWNYYANNSAKFYNKGSVGIGSGVTSPTAQLHIAASTGYDQLRLETSYTPSSTADTNGHVGDVAWDDNYMYTKTTAGWKRAALSTF